MATKSGAPIRLTEVCRAMLERQIYRQRTAAGFGACSARFGRMAMKSGAPNPADGGLRGNLALCIRSTEVCERIWRSKSGRGGLRENLAGQNRPMEVRRGIWHTHSG